MTDLTATPETGTVDAPASMDDVLSEFEAGAPNPSDAVESAVEELEAEAEEGDPEEQSEEADEDDATDAEEEVEEAAEEAPESEEEQPDPVYKVKVNGAEVEVPLSELLKGYSREADYTNKTMALAEERKALQSQFASDLQKHVEQFEALDPLLSEAANIDWQALAKADPATYVQLQAELAERQRVVTEARKKIEQARSGQSEADAAKEAEEATRETAALIQAVPDLAEPAKMNEFALNAVNYLRGTGFDDGEIREVTDHRALLIIDKARRFDELEKARRALPAKKVVPKPQAKSLKTDGTNGSQPQKSRFPVNAPRERKLDHVVNQLLEKG